MTEPVKIMSETFEQRQTTLFCLIFIMTALMTVSLFEVGRSHEVMKHQKEELNRIHTQYQSMSGWTSLWGGNTNGVSYNLSSFDAGKTWYAIHNTTNDEVIIDGLAETVYPGLRKTLLDWNNILAYAVKNGPINPNNPDDLKVLESNGFSVTRKTN